MACASHNEALLPSSGFSTIICLTRPAADESEHVPSAAKALIRFMFDHRSVAFERDASDLIIKDGNGGSIILDNFFMVGDTPLPVFKTVSGEKFSASDLLFAFDPGFDSSTAEISILPSGGAMYEDDAGELTDCIYRVSSLGAECRESAIETETELFSQRTFFTGAEIGGTDPPFSADLEGKLPPLAASRFLAIVEQIDPIPGSAPVSPPLETSDPDTPLSGHALDSTELRDLIADIKGDGETLTDLLSFQVAGGNTAISVSEEGADGVSRVMQQIELLNVFLSATDTGHGTCAELEAQLWLLTSQN